MSLRLKGQWERGLSCFLNSGTVLSAECSQQLCIVRDPRNK